MDDRYERVGKLAVEDFHTEAGYGSKQVVVFRCAACSALVDADHFTDHNCWHDQLDRIERDATAARNIAEGAAVR